MSVRAYRVNEIMRDDNSSFNLWHDKEIIEWLGDNTEFYNRLNMDGCGISEISLDDLKRMALELEPKIGRAPLNEICNDIAWADVHGKDWIEYDCY